MRFFLVLDEVPDGFESIWGGLLSVLSNGAPGSFVMITTQSERVAKTIGNMPNIIALDVLKREYFQQLFDYYAFGSFKPSLHPLKEEEFSALKSIGKKIADKLHGLPLAGVVIGTMLSSQLNKEYWKKILENDWWNDEYFLKDILPSLGVGYMNLHPDLRQCFAFCSIFPKHYVFEKDRLVQMWIAHDFIQPSREDAVRLDTGVIRLEDIGRNWFDKLVERSFFHLTVSDGKYIMHDLIRDLAIAVSSTDFCFVSNNMQLPSCTRHMAIDCNGLKVEWKNKNNTRLRTILFFGNWKNCGSQSISNIFAQSYGLRLLDLSYIGIQTNEPLSSICQLFHLRFLDLSFSGIKSIPDNFCALCHLQVLDVRGCTFKTLPKNMNNLVNLRHLYASAETFSLIPGIGKLTNLQELDEFRIGTAKGHKISELMDMNEISGHLLLNNLHNVSSKEEAATAQLAKKMHLKNLELKYGYIYRDQTITRLAMDVLDALKPSPSIEMLTINGGRLVSFPGWMLSDFFNLRSVHVCSFDLTSLPAFGELPSLEVLSLYSLTHINKVGSEFYGHSHVAFPCLKELTFSDMCSWREWSDAGHGKSFPLLKKLCLSCCPKLMEIPANCLSSTMLELNLSICTNLNITWVLEAMSSLTHLSIDNCCDNLSIYCTPLKNSLEFMTLKQMNRLHFVGGLKCFVNLRKLVIWMFNEILESFEMEQETDEIIQECQEQCLQSLTFLHLRYGFSIKIQSLHKLAKLPSLRTLLIGHFSGKEYKREDESWFQQLTSLEELHFYYCRRLTHLPSTLPTLSSLKKLTIICCPSISSLPETSLPQKLTELYISGCPNLVHRCEPQGDDWCKISHIPYIRLQEADPDYTMMKKMNPSYDAYRQ